MDRIKELEEEIKFASYCYYDGEGAIMTDADFDSLVDELKSLDPNNPLITKVGYGSEEVSHKNDTVIPIEIKVSLPKIKFNNKEAISSFLSNCSTSNDELFISPKLDGMSVIVTYENKTLKSMISRGNGVKGMDLTSRFLPLIKSGNFDIPYHSKKDGTVRGELFIKKSVFEDYLSEDYANPRNATSGIVNSDSEDNKQFISFLQHPQFNNIGLPIAPTHHLESDGKLIEYFYKLWLEDDFPIDGIVIDYVSQGVLCDSVAVKFPTVSIQTTVKNISWQLSSRNRYIPVVEFEPVQLYGTEVERATGLHYQYIIDNGIGKGAIIEVTKANEIIPQITKVVKSIPVSEINIPDNFTVVGLHAVKLLETESEWYSHFSRNFFSRALSTTNIKSKTVYKILDALKIKTIYDLCNLVKGVRYDQISVEQFKEVAGSVTGTSFYTHLKELKLESRKLLRTLGVDGVGYVTTEKLHSNPAYFNYLTHRVNKPDEIPVTSNVMDILRNETVHKVLVDIYEQLFIAGIIIEDKPIEKEVDNYNTKVCLSGKFPNMTKSQLIEKFASNWNVVDSLDKDCKYLVVPTLDRVSSKVTKSQKWGIEIIDFEQFLKLNDERN